MVDLNDESTCKQHRYCVRRKDKRDEVRECRLLDYSN